ncbi:hypothetical protein [Spirosoma soli]
MGPDGEAITTFYTSGQQGRYLIVVQDITADGRFTSSQQGITIGNEMK